MARRAGSAGQSELPLMAAGVRVRAANAPLVTTIGHSSRGIADLVVLLTAHEVTLLFDVRAAPYSRRHPQFNRESLAATLAAAGIGYRHMPALGGMRKPLPDSVNTGWPETTFRGYADHMGSAAFVAACDAVIDATRAQRVAVMCAEADPENCHRRLIADALLARGIAVEHIIDAGARRAHELTPFARVREGAVSYPPRLHR